MTARLSRLLAAVLLVAGGFMHYTLWKSGYRAIPKIGPLFLANFVGSIALAGAVLVSRRATVSLAAMAFAAGSLIALVLSRTVGVLGFTETVWTTEAVKTLASEIGVVVTLSVAGAMQLRTRHTELRLAPALSASKTPPQRKAA